MSFTREEHVKLFKMPYTLLLFRTSNNESESLFEEDPDELYFKDFKQAMRVFIDLTTAMEEFIPSPKLFKRSEHQKFSHIILMKYGMGGEPEDGDCLEEWDEDDFYEDLRQSNKCCLCDNLIPLGRRGNNAQPLKDGKCCDKCNDEKVIPTRLGLIVQTEA